VLPDDVSLRQLLDSASELPTATARAVAVVTVWDLVANGALSAASFLGCVNAVLAAETADSLVEPFLQLAVVAAMRWAPDSERDRLLSSVADVCLALADQGGPHRMVAVRALARTAVTPDQLTSLRALADGDVDLTWRAFTRLASLDDVDPAAVAALEDQDPDPDSWVRTLAVETARPHTAAKQAGWDTVMLGQKVPIGSIGEVAAAFWQPSQSAVLAPFAERYLEVLGHLGSTGMIPAMVRAQAMFPLFGAGREFVDRVVRATETPGFSPVVRGRVLERADQLTRMLDAREGREVRSRG
jgi:aminopeptidase N